MKTRGRRGRPGQDTQAHRGHGHTESLVILKKKYFWEKTKRKEEKSYIIFFYTRRRRTVHFGVGVVWILESTTKEPRKNITERLAV